MQIAVTLSVAFKGCKATHCNATQSFWWIPDAMTCLLHILILLLFFLIHIELSEAPAFWSYFLNFLLKLYLFSLPPASEDQSLASTAELLSRCPITVLHIRLCNKGHLSPLFLTMTMTMFRPVYWAITKASVATALLSVFSAGSPYPGTCLIAIG